MPYAFTKVDPAEIFRASGQMTSTRQLRPAIGTAYRRRSTLRGFAAMGSTFPPSDTDIDDILNSAAGDPNGTAQKIDTFLSGLGIGSGRTEADIIVPVQNRFMSTLGAITDAILTGKTPSVSQLQSFYTQVVTTTNNFIQFCLASRFTDRRASGQALNTVMPFVDGTCGYAVPIDFVAMPTQFNCISWGAGTLGGVGTNGILGSLARTIAAMGGSTPDIGVIDNPPVPGGVPGSTMGGNTWLYVGVGMLALYVFSKKGGF